MLVSELLAGLAAKLAELGLAAKAALGVGLATVAATTAGAAGVLPDQAQRVVADVVDAVTGVQLPDPKESSSKVVDDVTLPDLDPVLPDDGVGEDDGTDDSTGDVKANHGACVSAVAKDKSTVGRAHGLAVSTAAKSDCGKEDKTATSTPSSSTTSSTSTTTTTLGGGDGEATTAQLDGGNRGKGKGNSGPSNNGGSSQNRGRGGGNSGSGQGGK